jgi:hypothetical protein
MTTALNITDELSIPHLGTIFRVNEQLRLNEYIKIVTPRRVPSIRQIAYARMVDPMLKNVFISVREGIVYRPNHLPIVMLDSPLLFDSDIATMVHNKGQEYTIDPEPIWEVARSNMNKNPLDKRALIAPKNGLLEISKRTLVEILPPDKRARFQHERISAANLKDCIATSLPYLRDDKLINSLDPITQFAIGLYKDVPIAYALYTGQ